MGTLILLGFVAFVIVGLAHAAYHSRGPTIKRALRTARLHPTASFPPDTVATVQGTVRSCGEAPLVAPLTGRACVYYEAIVEEPQNKKGWQPIIHERQGQDFLLDDGQGTALVMMRNATVLLVNDAHFRTGLFQHASFTLEGFLRRHGQTSQGWLFNKNLRFREGVIEAGERVAVCGQGKHEADPDPQAATGGYRDTPTRLVLAASPEMPLYVSDDISTLR